MDEELIQRAMEAKSLEELLELMEEAGLDTTRERKKTHFGRFGSMAEKLSGGKKEKAPDSGGGG